MFNVTSKCNMMNIFESNTMNVMMNVTCTECSVMNLY